MVQKWDKLNSKSLGDYRIFKARADTTRSPRTGKEHTFFVLEAPDWINVIPITPQGKVVMIHQFRHGNKEITLEIPGGMMDLEDPSPAETARRELLEETGYEVDDIIHIGSVAPNPAFLDNQLHTFLATNARWKQTPQFDGAEDIAVEEIDLAEIPHLIATGRITHALVVAAFYHYEHYKRDA